MDLDRRVDALEVMHVPAVTQTPDAPVHHHAAAIGTTHHRLRLPLRAVRAIVFQFNAPHHGEVQRPRAVVNDLCFHPTYYAGIPPQKNMGPMDPRTGPLNRRPFRRITRTTGRDGYGRTPL